MKITFKNRIKICWHQFLHGSIFHNFVINEGHLFCTCGYGDTRPPIDGVDPEYRRLVERAAYAEESYDIPFGGY